MKPIRKVLIALGILLASATTHELFAREYDPRTGRFLQTDPLIDNRPFAHYTYADNNPVMFTDPTGEIVVIKKGSPDKDRILQALAGVTGTDKSFWSTKPHEKGDQIFAGNIAKNAKFEQRIKRWLDSPEVFVVNSEQEIKDLIGRRFLQVYGDPGKGVHNAGRSFMNAATTSKNNIETTEWFLAGWDSVEVKAISGVTDLVEAMKGKPIYNMSYFGHSWTGVLLIGQESGADTNLALGATAPGGKYATTPITALTPNFKKTSVEMGYIALYGCRGGYSDDSSKSIAQIMANHCRVPTFGFTANGGSIYTNDPTLGGLQRKPTQADMNARIKDLPKQTWMVPSNGTEHKQFGPE